MTAKENIMPSDAMSPGPYLQELPSGRRPVTPVATAIAAFVGAAAQGPAETAVPLQSMAAYTATFGDGDCALPMSRQVKQFFVNGGIQAIVVRVTPAADGTVADAEIRGDRDRRSGIYALEAIDLFNLLCLCPSNVQTDLAPASWATAAAYCRDRRALLLIDAPLAWSTATDPAQAAGEGIAALRAGIDAGSVEAGGIEASANAALYFPHLLLAGNGQPALAAPSGTIAGLMARIDGARGLWHAPAGTTATLKGVTDLASLLSDQQNDRLNGLAVNCLRNLPVWGNIPWGSRTLAGDRESTSDWKYIPARRLALFIEESVRRGIAWAAFEDNDRRLWDALRDEVEAFLQSLFLQGAFQGLAAEEAYFVKCGADTVGQRNLAPDIAPDPAQGIVNIVIGFAPLKPAEFVVISLSQIARKCP